MKKYLLICFSLFTLSSSLLAQSWLWGAQGIGALKSNANGGIVATDKDGNSYMAGNYESTITFGTFTLNTNYDNVYLVKYNSLGIVQWATQPGYTSNSASYATSITTDVSGNIYITGNFTETITFGSFVLYAPSGSNSVFIAKYNSLGTVLWAKQSNNSSGIDLGTSVITDKRGNAYICGNFSGTMVL
ncbi:MAG TPA: SBBP repeat-containing protein, partial [Bacteroidia bacterium]|nr:SBBP repeat-containing protein [Bacteroidia bacterium]